MTRRRLLPIALLLLATAPPQPAPAAADDARALVDSVAARYERLPRYRFEGVVNARATGAGLGKEQSLAMPFRYAAVRPSRLLTDARNPSMPTLIVADGESLWISAPALGQYLVQKAPSFAPGASLDPMTRSFDGVLSMAAGLGAGLAGARSIGRDTVHTAAGPVSCRRLELSYAPDSTRPGARVLPRVLWIDEARGVVLRDSSTNEITHAQFGEVRQVQDTRWVVADVKGDVPDSLFAFTPPAESRRVRRLGVSNDPDDAGKPAADFSLAVLDGKGRKVSLAAQKGKVVVLDFWATWCGPCRRWMPIVAKLEKETAGKDVKFFAVNLREPPATVRKYVSEQKVQVPVLMDSDGNVGTAYGARSIPLTVVVGRDGKIVRTLLGLHPEEDLRDALREAGVEGI
jgi:thiol-disulfide isomerase/thioredoxin